MNAFRFLSLITVGFSLLVLVFLLNATQGRMESEATRVLKGPELTLAAGETAEWILHLGGGRVEEAWPAPQRQPRFFLVGATDTGLGEAHVTVQATYSDMAGKTYPAFIAGGASASGVPGEIPGELECGPLWMNWDFDLHLKATVQAVGAGGTAQLVMRGDATEDYLAARSMARTLWAVFTAIAAAGFAGLMLTMGEMGPGRQDPG